ncbi:hypothetical protein GCM10009834_26850 [Streptomonospora arabica]
MAARSLIYWSLGESRTRRSPPAQAVGRAVSAVIITILTLAGGCDKSGGCALAAVPADPVECATPAGAADAVARCRRSGRGIGERLTETTTFTP